MKTALSIAGSDCSGGAGIQADLKTMTMNGVYAMSAITALTAQNTTGVQGILEVTPEFLSQQINSVFTDIRPDAVAACHPQGSSAVFTGDRGSAVAAMAVAFEHFVRGRDDIAGLLSAGGSGGTALVAPAMRALPVGTPKVLVSTVASGDTLSAIAAREMPGLPIREAVQRLQIANNLNSAAISAGASIVIPSY